MRRGSDLSSYLGTTGNVFLANTLLKEGLYLNWLDSLSVDWSPDGLEDLWWVDGLEDLYWLDSLSVDWPGGGLEDRGSSLSNDCWGGVRRSVDRSRGSSVDRSRGLKYRGRFCIRLGNG